MDGATEADGTGAAEHSDSDSGESWTFLENNPSYAHGTPGDAPAPVERPTGDASDGTDKDEDTDGISIISDSESESIAPCDHANQLEEAQHRPTELHTTSNYLEHPQHTKIRDDYDEATRYEDFLGDSTGKHKTYVHRRNKKLSTVLNVILLGSVITAAGVAIGHMWGVRDDCTLQAHPSVNKILSNLYKLQEENAFLRSKLREVTVGNVQLQQKKATVNTKPHKCRKVFEEPLHNLNVVKTTKCLDIEMDISKPLEFQGTQLPLQSTEVFDSAVDEKEFKSDVNKLKKIYKENKNWLDAEVAQRLKRESVMMGHKSKISKDGRKEERYNFNVEGLTVHIRDPDQIKPPGEAEVLVIGSKSHTPEVKETPEKIVSYADSVKSINKMQPDALIVKKETKDAHEYKPQRKYRKKHEVRESEDLSDEEEEFPKDNRYSGGKYKYEKNKYDRQRLYKKQKRDNKYEQWEMKGGYMKDFDSVSSSSNENIEKPIGDYDKNHYSQEWERVNYMDQFSDIESVTEKVTPTKRKYKQDSDYKKETANAPNASENAKRFKIDNKSIGEDGVTSDWFEKRSALRKEARERLEAEIGKANLKSGRWYFRRMSEREQCRALGGNNSTKRKINKRNLNFKNKR